MNLTLQDLLDPLIDASAKGFPPNAPALRRSAIGAQGWRVLAGDLPLPLAVLRRDALAHNLGWMRDYARAQGVDLAPHGKTTMSPQLFQQQLAAGAWGLSVANVTQARVALAAGAARCVIANQVLNAVELDGIAALLGAWPAARLIFLADSVAQVERIEAWHGARDGVPRLEVLLEIGVPGARCGCRTHEQALALARRIQASPALRLVGVECYEGLGVSGDTATDAGPADALMQRVRALALEADRAGWFDADEVIVSAGGSAIFDLVAGQLKPALSRPVRALLRSGCYVTHDHGFYRRMLATVGTRLRCDATLHAALEVWTTVQSLPEPGLAILSAGKRDLSYDLDLPVPIAWAGLSERAPRPAPASWRIAGMNDQHAYLRWDGDADPAPDAGLRVGDRVALGISHPCTTFDKWRWLPVVDADYRVVDAVVTCF